MEKRVYTELPPELVKVKEQGFVVFDSGNYDLNIIGFRKLGNIYPVFIPLWRNCR